jgi:serine/threonine protein kinase
MSYFYVFIYILGDGGFAKNAKLPQRKLEDYKNLSQLNITSGTAQLNITSDITQLNITIGTVLNGDRGGDNNVSTDLCTMDDDVHYTVEKIISSVSTHKHVFIRATYDTKEVVLKGFIMSDKTHREGLEKELSILVKLNSHLIIRPRAVVETFEGQFTVFIEFPYYRDGNLSLWLQKEGRR